MLYFTYKLWVLLDFVYGGITMNKIDELKEIIMDSCPCCKKPEPKKTSPWVIALAVIGAIASVAAIAYAVYYFLIPEDSEDFEDFDDDFEDFDDDEDDLEGDE